jgi:hypothetical protein
LTNLDQHRRRQFIEGLRAVAQFYEQNPDAWYDGMPITLNMYVWGRTARDILARTVRALGSCDKSYDDTNLTLSRKFSDQVTLAIFAPRAKVCRRLILGTRVLPAKIIPACPELRLPAAREQIIEWKCDPLLTKDGPH